MVQDSAMSYYEDLLTLGSNLREFERVTLYKFLLDSKRENYVADAYELINTHSLKKEIANGDIFYSINGKILSYSAKKKGRSGYIEDLRTLQLKGITKLQINKIIKFFAQSEVDVIWNYPIEEHGSEDDGSFTIISFPYSDLRYYSESRSRIFGFFNKLKSVDTKLLHLLKTS